LSVARNRGAPDIIVSNLSLIEIDHHCGGARRVLKWQIGGASRMTKTSSWELMDEDLEALRKGSRAWGYGPSGIVGLILVILLILLLLHKI
jgi:hypothetical protein